VKRTLRAAVATSAAGLLVLSLTSTSVLAQEPDSDPSLPDRVPGTPTVTYDPDTLLDGPLRALQAEGGDVTVSLNLTDPALAEVVGEDAKQEGFQLTAAQQRQHVQRLEAKQDALVDKVEALGATEVARVQKAENSVVVTVDASKLDELVALPEVEAVRPFREYQLDLDETVPYVGAAQVHQAGLTGAGVRVAVLDSGIDYTHARFGGAGTAEAYEAAYGTGTDDPRNTTRDGLFPTPKVIEGWDFVGERWPDVPQLEPDEDPIDCGAAVLDCGGGHGTHVASIIAGDNGMAPGAELYAYKVCSAVSTSCSGVAMLQAIERALDPNGDNDLSDAVDVINMSIGSPYGQIEDDTAGASANAVRMGVVVVASAGNSGDKPYVTGSPGSTPEVLSVAQTHVPGALGYVLRVDSPDAIAGIYKNTNTVEWAPITTGFTGSVKYGSTAAGQLGCVDDAGGTPYAAGYFDGQVALIDRGVCAISMKVHNAAEAGAIGVLIANNVAGEAPSFSFGGPDPFTAQQTLVIGQEHGATIKGQLAAGVTVAVDPADAVPLIGTMVSTSSRGPSMSFDAIKPEIGAPGASVSAEAGTGTGETAFGGTSGAAPVVAGAAALLLEANPDRSPLEVKSLLMNTGETEIYINPITRPGDLAEITRIGGGELRVDRAVASNTAAWVQDGTGADLSFGYLTVHQDLVLRKTVTIRNYGDRGVNYRLEPTFRYEDDRASGAVRFTGPRAVRVPANSQRDVTVTMRIDASKLPEWQLDGGPGGGDGTLLALNEFDGYLQIRGGGDEVHLPWHVLPHKAADIDADKTVKLNRRGVGELELENETRSGQPGGVDIFALTGTSPRIPPSQLPGEGDNFAVVDLRSVGVRTFESGVIQFGISTHGDRSHPNYPAEFDIYVDSNDDGIDDFVVYNAELGGFNVTGQNVVYVVSLRTGTGAAYYYTEADLNSSNVILTAPLAALGLTQGSRFSFDVYAFDNYFTGSLTDAVEDMTFTVGTPRYAVGSSSLTINPRREVELRVTSPEGGAEASPSQTGFLLLYQDGRQGRESQEVRVRP